MRYTAEVERDGRYWLVRVPEIDEVTQALSRREIEPQARDLIALMEEVEPDSFDLVVHMPGETSFVRRDIGLILLGLLALAVGAVLGVGAGQWLVAWLFVLPGFVVVVGAIAYLGFRLAFPKSAPASHRRARR